jgi:hypothetical protein
MKIKIILIVMVIFLVACKQKLPVEELIAQSIDIKCLLMDSLIKSGKYQTVEESIDNGAGKLSGFFDKDSLKKISYTGDASDYSYYFENEKVLFAHIKYHEGDQIDENTYYFENEKLIKWLDKDKKSIEQEKLSDEEVSMLETIKADIDVVKYKYKLNLIPDTLTGLTFMENFIGKYSNEILEDPFFEKRMRKWLTNEEDFYMVTGNLVSGSSPIEKVDNEYVMIVGQTTNESIVYESVVVADIKNNLLSAAITGEDGKVTKFFTEGNKDKLPLPLQKWIKKRK